MSLNRSASPSSSSHSTVETHPNRERKAQPSNAFLLKTDPNVMRNTLNGLLTTQEVVRLSTSNAQLHSTYQRDLNKRALQQLLQAVVDDDRARATRILDSNPELLLKDPADEKITEIESKYTFQRFCAAKALIMAQMLHRLEMTKILLSSFEKLEEKRAKEVNHPIDEKSALLTQWVLPPYDEAKQQLHNEKLQQKYINDYFNPLTKAIAGDPCTDRVAGLKTEEQLAAFRNTLLSEKPVAIENYVDAEQLLIAAYKANDDNRHRLTWNQRDVFAIRVIRLIQSVVSPELGKAYCEGLSNVVNRNQPIGVRARSLTLADGSAFYLAARNSRLGPSDFPCSIYGAERVITAILGVGLRGMEVERLCRANAAEFGKLTRRVSHAARYHVPTMYSRCMLL